MSTEEPEPGTETGDEPDPNAEPQPGDEPEPGEQPAAPPAAPPPAGPQSFEEAEAIAKKIDQARKANATRLSNILEESALDYFPCPLCGDWTPGFVSTETPQRLDEERLAMLRMLVGSDPSTELEPAQGVIECPSCKGHGLLAFPSKVPGIAQQTCSRCQGTGWILDPDAKPEGGTVHPLPLAPQQPAAAPAAAMPNDGWERPWGHPHYGMPPASVGA